MPCSSSNHGRPAAKAVAILVAGGSGSRMGTDVPKQFLLLDSAPVLVHTFRRFFHSGLFSSIIIVLPRDQMPRWEEIRRQYLDAGEEFILAPGGSSRSESVLNGLRAIPEPDPDCMVAIHDGVRPFVNRDFLQECLDTARRYGNAIPCITPPESFRYMESGQAGETASHAIDRQRVRSIQTPQCFRLGCLTEAYEKQESRSFTDEASLLESCGNAIRLCEGLPQNIKITRPFDLKIAGFLLQNGY